LNLELTDQLLALAQDFKFDIAHDEVTFDFVLPAATLDRRRNSLPAVYSSFRETDTTGPPTPLTLHNTNNMSSSNHNTSTSPNLSLSNPYGDKETISKEMANKDKDMVSKDMVGKEEPISQLHTKEAELRRVAARAQQEAAKATFLRRKKEELQQRLATELNTRKDFIKETKQSIERKEKEISRLSFLAEQDKKTGMFLCQQIAQLKKSLEGFLQAREESKPETLCTVSLSLLPPSILDEMHHGKILARCSSSNDLCGSPPASPVHTTVSSRFATAMCTVIGKETEAVRLEDEKKSQELVRVKLIVEQESKRVDSLKLKVEELKQGLVAELQQADEQLEKKMQEFMQKQQAIEKVVARAERERARSYFLKDEIVKLTNALGAGKDASKRKGKSDEYGPDVAYLSSFSELPELSDPEKATLSQTPSTESTTTTTTATIAGTNSDVAKLHSSTTSTTSTTTSTSTEPASTSDREHASTRPLSIVNLRARDDPSMYIFSPPCRTIPISPASECIYVQKLKDIAVLKRETSKKDEELVRLKKLAEAERCRHLLLKDKFEQLRIEMREREAYGACTL